MGNYVRVRTFCYRYYITDLLFSTILTLNKSSNFILSVKVKLWGFKYPGTPEGGGIFSSSPCHKDTLIRLHKPFLLQIWHHRSIQKVNIDPSIYWCTLVVINGGYMSGSNRRLRWVIGCSDWWPPSSKMDLAQKWRGWRWLEFLHFILRCVNVKKDTLWRHYHPSKK